MTKLEEIQAAEARLLIHTYDRFPVLFVAGEDVYLIDEKGDRYLDLLSGIGVNALGYSSKVIQEAIAQQSRTLINASNYYFNDKMAGLAERVTRITGMDRVYFGNSGCEAIECCTQAGPRARRHSARRRQADRHEVPRSRTELSWPHLWRHLGDVQGKISRALRTSRSRLRVCELQRH
jgi:acetylornithine/succinyldiaminopimelate/putrescine aminotransferase